MNNNFGANFFNKLYLLGTARSQFWFTLSHISLRPKIMNQISSRAIRQRTRVTWYDFARPFSKRLHFGPNELPCMLKVIAKQWQKIIDHKI